MSSHEVKLIQRFEIPTAVLIRTDFYWVVTNCRFINIVTDEHQDFAASVFMLCVVQVNLLLSTEYRGRQLHRNVGIYQRIDGKSITEELVFTKLSIFNAL